METSASFEARSAPSSYPTGGRATASGDPVAGSDPRPYRDHSKGRLLMLGQSGNGTP